MEDLVCIQKFDNSMEAELCKNALESAGIYAALSMDENEKQQPIQLVVQLEDRENAMQILEGDSAQDVAPVDAKQLEEMAIAQKDQESAKDEFEAIHLQEMQYKAGGVKKSFTIMIIVLFTGVVIFFFLPNKYLGLRLSMGCLLYAIIELFIGLDSLKAAKNLRKNSQNPS